MMDLEKLMELSVDLICTINGEGKFVEVSAASIALLGYTPAEMRGRNYTDFIDTADITNAAAAMAEVRRGAELHIQNRYIDKTGQVVPLRWSAKWDEEGQLLYAIARSGAITEREEAMRIALEESNQRYGYASRATSDAIWDWDITRGTLYWGDNFETIFGYSMSGLDPGIDSWIAHIHPAD